MDMETHHARTSDTPHNPVPSPEAVEHLAQITRAAFEALSLDYCYFKGRSGSADFARPQSEWLHQTYNFPGCPDASKLLEFFAGHKTKLLWPNHHIHIDATVSELCSWLLRHGDDSIRADLATGVSWGVPEPQSGIETVVAQFLNEPKSAQEFHCAVSWCLRTSILPIRADIEPAWISQHTDPSRASSLAKAWMIVATMIKQPENLCPLLNQESTGRGIPTTIARELGQMLYGTDHDHTARLRGMIERVRRLPSVSNESTPHLMGLVGRCALTICGTEAPVARALLSALSKHGMKNSTLEALQDTWKRSEDQLGQSVRSFPYDRVGPAALRRLFTDLASCSDATIDPRITDSLIKLSLPLIDATDPWTIGAEAFRAIYVFAASQGLKGVRAFVDSKRPIAWSDDQWREHLDQQALNLSSILPEIINDVASLGLEREILPLIYSKGGLDQIKQDECTPALSIKFAHQLPEQERYPVLERALSGAGQLALAHFPPSLEVLLLLGKFPSLHVECISAGSELARILLAPKRGAEAFKFLSSCPDEELNPSISWPRDNTTAFERRTALSDRIKFLSRFADICALSDESLEQLYSRLDDPLHPLFARQTSVVSELFACSKALPTSEVVLLFEKLVRSYLSLGGDLAENIDLHQRLIAGEERYRVGWLRALVERLDPIENRDLEREFKAFSEYLKIFGRFEEDHLYFNFSRFYLYDSVHPMMGEACTPEEYKELLASFKSALAEDRFNFTDIGYYHHASVLCVALGGGAVDSRPFLHDVFNDRLWVKRRENLPRPPLATLSVRSIQRKSITHTPQSGVMQRVHEFRAQLLRVPPLEDLKESIVAEAAKLRVALRSRIEQLKKIEGKGAFFAQRNIQALEEISMSIARTGTLKEFIESCATAQPAYGKEVDVQVITSVRRLGIQALQERLPSRHRSWTDSVYDEREQLEGCVGVLREELRDADIQLSPEGRSLWKRAFSVKSLEEEVYRLHVLDGQVAGFGEEVVIDIRKGGNFISNVAGYVCHSCITPYPFTDLLEQNTTFSELHPNATFYIFARRHESGPRLIGGTFILDVQSVSNDRVWLLRGFNPTQSAALAIDIGEFFEKFIDEITPAAKAEGVQAIAVPYDLYSGRTQTNRPSVHAYISRAYYNQPKVIKLAPHTSLNDLPVTQACVVRTLS